MKSSKKIQNKAFKYNFFLAGIKQKKMPVKAKKVTKAVAKKIFKVKRITDAKGDKNNFVIRWKGDWEKQEIKDFRSDLDYYISRYLDEKLEDEDEKRDVLTDMRQP